MKLKWLLPFMNGILALFVSFNLYAQEITVTGRVVDKQTNAPLAGATVKIKNSTVSTVTDLQGAFRIKAPSSESIITITYVGYKLFEDKVGDGTLNVSLESTGSDLNEVVVVGYGTQKKAHLTGSVGTLEIKKIEDIPVGSLSEALKGQINGVSVTGGYARPGEPATITIRNPVYFSKDGGSKEPLFIIDDIFRTKSDFDMLDASEIENVSVLKDAAAAIYGILGSNGVVLVKTKRGKSGTAQISYSSSYGIADATFMPKVMTGADQATLLNDYNTIRYGKFDSTKSDFYFPDEVDYFRTHNYDWLSQAWQQAFEMRQALNISGGTEKATYFAGFTYNTANSNFDGSRFNRYSFRASSDIKLATGLKLGLSLSANLSDKKNTFSKQGSEDLNNDWRTLLTTPQFNPPYVNGLPVLIQGTSGGSSAVSNYHYFAIHQSDNYTQSVVNGVNFQGQLSYDFPFLKGLRASVNYNRNLNNTWGKQYGTKYSVYQFKMIGGNKHIYGDQVSATYLLSNGDRVRLNPQYTDNYQLNGTINYDKRFGQHQINALFSYEQSESMTDGVSGMAEGVVIGGLDNMNFALGTQTTSETISESGRLAYIGRLNYNYASKYLVELQFRADASIRFAPENRWGYFPSGSLGWVISEEKFFRGLSKTVNYLKLRGSAGFLGLDATKSYQWLRSYAIQTGKAAVFGGNGDRGLAVVTNVDMANRDVHWDDVDKYNVGLDAKFLNNRLSASVDGFVDYRRNMLSSLTTAPSILIGTPIPSENFGAANTFGYEITVGWKDKINKDWNYNVTANFNWNDNKVLITDVAALDKGTFKDPTGKSSDKGFYGYKCLGMFRTQADVDNWLKLYPNYKVFGNAPAPGMLYFEDVRGPQGSDGKYAAPDGTITSADQTYLNQHAENHYGLGLNWGISYKSISLNVVMGMNWGGVGSVESAARKVATSTSNRPTFWNDHWTPNNTNAAYPAPYYTYSYDLATDYWWRSSFSFRVTNFNLSYTVPQRFMNNLKMQGARFYIVGTNPINFYNPYDYKDNGSGSFDVFPTLRSFSLGLNLNL